MLGTGVSTNFFFLGGIFTSTKSFTKSLDMLSATINGSLSYLEQTKFYQLQKEPPNKILSEWKKLDKRTRDLSLERNNIAHFGLWGNDDTSQDILAPAIFNKRIRSVIDIKGVSEICSKFVELQSDLEKFQRRINVYLTPHLEEK